MQQRQEEIRKALAKRAQEEEEKKFEDEDYLKSYFSDMRHQIEADF